MIKYGVAVGKYVTKGHDQITIRDSGEQMWIVAPDLTESVTRSFQLPLHCRLAIVIGQIGIQRTSTQKPWKLAQGKQREFEINVRTPLQRRIPLRD